ncbi:uncharacterized protein LOC121246054 [Juglans microcarpa x Juglans regia]|uniref:uncharacterized protein LOC121246054 n=1 Tax=Juglans microcarpa x Juglans regia TaxID=2249226 RepID=UPI001B7DF22C|nr:uncharacterized protein LOC121246054 [Juglans microcarpa x Juglans regia]
MEVAEMDEALKVLDSSLSLLKWRLKFPSKRRLEIDILALCTGMRAAVLVDYGGKMPELQERLCGLVKIIQKESPIFENLRVMVIEDMIYLIHVRGLAEHVRLSLSSEAQLLFVDLEHDPPKMVTLEQSPLRMQFVSIQKSFSLLFPQDGMKDDLLPCHGNDYMANDKSSTNELLVSQSSDFIDLSSCMQDTQVTVPTLNGWLLGYPVVYLFSKEYIADAVCNLSTKSLRIFKISVCRNAAPNKVSQLEELLSFSVPYELSMGGSNEPWAEAFLAHMQDKWGSCKQVWRSLQMEVSACYPQAAIVL